MIPSALPGGSPATIASLRDVLGIELLQAALATAYASQALGEAGTTTGQYFAVDAGGGTVSIYLRTGGGSTLKGTINVSGVAGGGGGGGGGTVTSVALSVGTGISLTGASPITGAGSWLLTLSAFLQAWSAIDPTTKSDVGHSHTFASLTSKPTTLAGYGINDAAALSHAHTFASLTSKPTTLAGYGINDAAALSHAHTFASLTSKPTTIAGYGIVDAAALSHSHTFASLTSKPTTIAGYGIVDAASLTSFSASSGSSLVGWLQSGTGAASRVLQGKVRERLSVKDFGAVGDGVTDDRANIILADAEAAASGRDLFFPTGTYMVSAAISGLLGSWVGERNSVIKATSGLTLNNVSMLTWSSADNVTVRGLTFDFQTRTITVGSEGVLAFISCDDTMIEHCMVLNMTGTGISLNGARRAQIDRCYISKAAAATSFNQSVLVDSSARPSIDVYIRNTRMVNSAIFMCCVNGWVENCHISGWGFGGGISTQQSANSFRYYFRNNTIESSALAYDVNATLPNGIENWSAYAVITGNQISECAGTGIACGGKYCLIADNVIFNNGTGWTVPIPMPGSGIVMQYADTDYNGSYAIVRDNTIFDTRAGGSKRQAYGYEEQTSGVVGVFLSGNRCFGNGTADEKVLGTNSWFSRQLSANGDWKISTTQSGGTLQITPKTAFGGDISVEAGNGIRLNGMANGHRIRWSSPNVEIFVAGSFAAGFGANTVGFNGTTPVAKGTITGSRGGNVGLANLLTYLDSTGILTNSTTA